MRRFTGLITIRRALLAVGLATAMLGLSGCGGIRHTNVVTPKYLEMAPNLATIGGVTYSKSSGDVLYVAGHEGVAAIDKSGKALWTLPLPKVGVRLLTVSGDRIGITGYTFDKIEEGNILAKAFIGTAADEAKFKDSMAAVVTTKGELLWSKPLASMSRVAPPAINGNVLGVQRAAAFDIFNLANGQLVATVPFELRDSIAGLDSQVPLNQPAVLNDAFFTSFMNQLKKIDVSGKVIADTNGPGLVNFQFITAGPLAFKDRIFLGNETQDKKSLLFKRPRIFAYDGKLSSDWNTRLTEEDMTGVGSLATNGETLFVASNFELSAFTPDGSKLWAKENYKGGLYPGNYRGLRFTNNYPRPSGYGKQLAATDKLVYITSSYNNGDAVTVLNAQNGEYKESINANAMILDMELFNDALVLATPDGLKFVALQ